MLRTRFSVVGLLVLAMLLAGCSGAGQSTQYEGSLVYNGASAGTHAATAECSKDGTFHWSMNIGMGSVRVTVTDGAGVTKYQESSSGTGQSANSKSLSGASGTWTIQVQRTASTQYGTSTWSGQYAAHLDC